MEMYLEELLVVVVYDGNGRRERYRGRGMSGMRRETYVINLLMRNTSVVL